MGMCIQIQNPLANRQTCAQTVQIGVVSTPSTSESAPVTDQTRWFAEEVRPHDLTLKAYIRGSFPAVRDVEDVVQESYLRVWRARTARPIASAKAFLFQVARRLAIDTVRRERHDFVGDAKDLDAATVSQVRPEADPVAIAEERTRLLADAIETLPSRCREVFILRKLQDFSQRETAVRLGLSERTVEVQVARAMKRCGEYLRRRGVTGFDEL